MCLAVPGKIIAVHEAKEGDAGGASGTVDFQGSRLDVSLIMTPEARVGDWVLVHAGFALNVVDEKDARETWDYLQEMETEVPQASTIDNNEDK
ncbi:MAG: HypC/HybG/HupF family hydrogenase formation chaperone [Planctomycetota bacterium]|nr:MAG: HypC/HybG/HupF family hydrogenase formation chaperone [Planctomycetota bacterium]